jgi:hypothetical protein
MSRPAARCDDAGMTLRVFVTLLVLALLEQAGHP